MPSSPHAAAGDWRRWPADLRDPNSAAVAVFAASHEHEVLFHCFLQWLADRSLGIAQSRAREAGMRIGLIADLAVGMDPDRQSCVEPTGRSPGRCSIGAPPDLFNPRGQDWGLTGFSPRALMAGGFAPFLGDGARGAASIPAACASTMSMGLTGLWLVPEGADADRWRLPGVSGHRPAAAARAWNRIGIRRSSWAKISARCRPVFATRWRQPASTACACCGSSANGQAFCCTRAWDRRAVAMTSTHDLPTVAGWWHGSDITHARRMRTLGVGVNEATCRPNAPRTVPRCGRRSCSAGSPMAIRRRRTIRQPVVDAALAFVADTHVAALPAADRGRARAGGTAESAGHHRRASQLAAAADRRRQARCSMSRAPRSGWRNWRRGGRGYDRAARDDAPAIASRLHLRRCDGVWCLTWPRWASAISTPRRSSPRAPGSMHGYDVTDPTTGQSGTGRRGGPAEPCGGAAQRRARAHRRYRAEPHGGRRHGEPLVGRCAAARPQQPLCEVLRHRLGQCRPDCKARCSRRSSANRTARRCAIRAITLDAR